MAIQGGPTGRARTVTWVINFHISADFFGDPNSYVNYNIGPYREGGGWPVGTGITGGAIANLLGCTLSAQALVIPIRGVNTAVVEASFSRTQGNGGSDNIQFGQFVPVADYVNRGTLTVTCPVYQNVETGPMPGTLNQADIYGLLVTSKVETLRQPQNDCQLCPFTLQWGPLSASGNFLLQAPIFDLSGVQLSSNCLEFVSTVSFDATCSGFAFGYPYSVTVSETLKNDQYHPNYPLGSISYYTNGEIGATLTGGVTFLEPIGYSFLSGQYYNVPVNYPIATTFGFDQSSRAYTVTGDFHCYADEYPDVWSVLFYGSMPGGGNPQKLQGNKTQAMTFQQNAVGSSIPGFPSQGGYDFVRVTPDPGMKDQGYGSIYGPNGPPMGKALVWNAVSLACANNIDFWPDHWTSVGGTGVKSLPGKQITLSKGTNNVSLAAKGTFNVDFLIAYRYLRFNVDSINNATQVVVSMNGKTYTVPLTGPGTIEVDLCLPDDAGFNFQDSMGPFKANGTLIEPSAMVGRWGLKWTPSITLNFNTLPNSDGTSSITISAMQLFRKTQPKVEILKAFSGVTPYVTAVVSNQTIQETWLRGITAIVDGAMAWEQGSWFSQGPNEVQFTPAEWALYISSIPGWSMALLDPGQPYTVKGLTECDEIGGGGWVFPSATNGIFTVGKTSQDYTSYLLPEGGATIPASLFYNYLYSDPGEGDVDTGVGYGSNAAPSVYRFLSHVRGKAWGIANPVYVGKSLSMVSEKDSTVAGTATIGPDGYWETGLPYGADNVVYDIVLGTKKAGSIPFHGARRNAMTTLQIATLGLSLESGIVGYWVFEAGGPNGFVVYQADHADEDLGSFLVIDSSSDCSEPAAFYIPEGRTLGVIYRRGLGTASSPYTIWRATSIDEGQTWPTTQLMNNVKHCRQVYNTRTKERVVLFIDQNNLLQSTIYDAYDQVVINSPTDQSGILQATCADTTFDARYIFECGFLDVVFTDQTGMARRARSTDEGRSYSEAFLS